jgi:hypothetical protein
MKLRYDYDNDDDTRIVPYRFEGTCLFPFEAWLRIHFPQDWVDAGCWCGTDYPAVFTFFESIVSEVK